MSPRRWSMRILFDHGTPAPLIPFLEGHMVTKAKDMGWERLVNGELLKAAEEAGFEVLLTTDKNMAAQQNLKSRAIAIVVLGNSRWRVVQRHIRKIAARVNAATPLVTPRGIYLSYNVTDTPQQSSGFDLTVLQF